MKRVKNKYSFIVSLIFLILFISIPFGSKALDIRTGDIIFHESWSEQGKAVNHLARGKYSHAGIIIVYYNNILVLEATARVKVSKLRTFIKRGVGRHFIVRRLKDYNNLINKKTLKKLERIGRRYIGKRYDYFFQWHDDRIYSAELIWKVFYKGVGIRLSGFRRLGSFDLTHPYIIKFMDLKFGDNIPLDEPVVTPDMIFNSGKLVTVYEN
jgi:hypothetical protein